MRKLLFILALLCGPLIPAFAAITMNENVRGTNNSYYFNTTSSYAVVGSTIQFSTATLTVGGNVAGQCVQFTGDSTFLCTTAAIGDISAVNVGYGLLGGGSAGAVTVSLNSTVSSMTISIITTSSFTSRGNATIPTITSSLTVTGAGGILTSTITFSPTTSGIQGTPTNDSASGGIVGEFVSSVVSVAQNFPATGAYGDLTSISLTPGDWDLSGCVYQNGNGATVTEVSMGISVTTGDFTTGLVGGNNRSDGIGAVGGVRGATYCVPVWRQSVSATTTYYLKYESTFTVATPTGQGRLSARRVR